jgi:hypothetical protein
MPTAAAKIVSNGINGVTGDYDIAPIAVSDLSQALKGIAPNEAAPNHVIARGQKLKQTSFARGLPWGVQPENLQQTGWAVVYPKDIKPEIRQALQPLVEHRRTQVGNDALVKELTYYPGEDAGGWLARCGAAWGNVQPYNVPYYLLWVGTPDLMPFEVSHEIDSDYCLGRLDFDSPDDYARYAKSVIEYETAASVRNTREAVFFGTRHPFDDATKLSADYLVSPLADGLPANGPAPAEKGIAAALGFRQRKYVADLATRANLLQLLGGSDPPPSLLFTAGHGMVWPSGDAKQIPDQGALLCQDWPGFGSVTAEHYVAGADLGAHARVHGLVAFFFACFGAGTPESDLYAFEKGHQPAPIAPRPFTAALPRRLLAHAQGGAIACIAHVERAWGSSITGATTSPQIIPFQRAIAQILLGKPIGLAVQEFNDLAATLSDALQNLLGKAYQGIPVDDVALTSTWLQRNDAAGFILLGDPAVKLRTDLI